MAFGDSIREEGESGESRFEKPKFFYFRPGVHRVRVLGEEVRKPSHWINRGYVVCPGDNCPICYRNKQIIAEDSDNFRSHSEYIPKTDRYYVNVLDRTPVKTCTNCNNENNRDQNNQFPPSCWSCGQSIMSVEEAPSNQIKIMSKGVRLFSRLGALDKTVQTEEGDRVGINNFDLSIMVQGTGKKQVTYADSTQYRDEIEYDENDLYDLDEIGLNLTSSELVDYMGGVSLRDIFMARSSDFGPPIEEGIEEIKSKVDNVFAH